MSCCKNNCDEECNRVAPVANSCQTLVFAKRCKCKKRRRNSCGSGGKCPPRNNCGGLFRLLCDARCGVLPSEIGNSF